MKIYKFYKKSIDTRSKEFKDWFGDWEDKDAFTSRSKSPVPSHAVNKDKQPKIMYHGTIRDFKDFEVGRDTYNSNQFGSWKTNRHAIFFTPSTEHANAFTSSGEESVGGNIRPVYLNMRSPLNLTKGVSDHVLEEFEDEGISPRWLRNFSWENFDGDDGLDFVNAAKRIGYDGVIFIDENPETRESMETWAVFDSFQIKSIF